jgi:hypothetical protein
VSRETSPSTRVADVRRRVETAFRQLDSALISAGARSQERALSVSPWSVLDVAEHVTLANHFLLVLAEKCARKSAKKLARGGVSEIDESVLERLDTIASRSFRWDAPEHMLPTGRVTLDTVRSALARQREQALSLLDMLPTGEGSLHTIRMTILGPDARLDVYEFLAFIALHAERHAAQARRIHGALGGAAG